MDTCTVEVGLLKKKPCGHAAVTHCLNCEQALCAQHAVPELTEAGKKTGKFMCKECEAARRQLAKNPAPTVKKPGEPAKPTPAAAKPAAPAAAPAAAPSSPAAPDPAASKPAASKPGYDGGIDYTPSKK